MASVINEISGPSFVELITTGKITGEDFSHKVQLSGAKINQPNIGNIVLYGTSTVGGGKPQPPPSVSTGSGQIFPTGRQ